MIAVDVDREAGQRVAFLVDDKAGEQRALRRMGADPRNGGRDRMDEGRGPFGFLGEQALHVDRCMNHALAERSEAQAFYAHGSTGMVWAASQRTVTGAPRPSTSPVWLRMKARSGTSSAGARMR